MRHNRGAPFQFLSKFFGCLSVQTDTDLNVLIDAHIFVPDIAKLFQCSHLYYPNMAALKGGGSPLTDEAWRPLEEGELLMVRHGEIVEQGLLAKC